MKLILFIIALTILLTACTTTQETLYSELDTVVIYYDYPESLAFKRLGSVQVSAYRPGFLNPTTTDMFPQLRVKALDMGGNALVIQQTQTGRFNDKYISVLAEVLYVD